METIGPVLLYIVAKFLPYSAWCGLGLWQLREPRVFRPALAAALGAARLFVGFVLGWLLLAATAHLAPAEGRLGFSVAWFALAIAILRWLEWSGFSMLIRRRQSRPTDGTMPRAVTLWRLGGVAVSFLSDAIVIFAVGVMGWVPC